MPIRIDAEAICHHCGAKARCTLDIDLLMSKRTQNLVCSEKCATALEDKKSGYSTSSYPGEWKRCGG
jgi:hypothetical protein